MVTNNTHGNEHHTVLIFSSVHVERRGSSINGAEVVSEGNVSMTLTRLRVVDEGTYICTVSVGHFHAQQVIKLNIISKFPNLTLIYHILRIHHDLSLIFCWLLFPELPDVSLSEEKLVLKENSPQKLSCHSSKYYPLDVQVSNCKCFRSSTVINLIVLWFMFVFFWDHSVVDLLRCSFVISQFMFFNEHLFNDLSMADPWTDTFAFPIMSFSL